MVNYLYFWLQIYFVLSRTIKNFRKTVFLYFLICFILIVGYANAVPMDYAHRPIPCFGCHGETLDVGFGDGECGNCHKYYLDVPRLEKEHNPNICRTCHIGQTIVNGTEREIFHNGHRAVNCTTCHTEDNFTVIKIKHDGFKCVSCHGVKIHGIHAKNINKACPICHGSWAEGKVFNKEGNPLNESREKDRLEGFTIFNFIRNLFNALLGIR